MPIFDGMTAERKSSLASAVQIGQLATSIVGFSALVFAMGLKSQSLEEARTDIDKLGIVVNDLAKAQASAAVTDASHAKTLEEIQRRLDTVERRIN